MPTHVNLHYRELESVWPGVIAAQKLADQHNISDIFQDAGGKMLQLAVALGLDIQSARNGPDATDRVGNEYEVKTTDLSKTTGGFSTNHHLNHSTIRSYRKRKWVFAFYEGITLKEAYLVDPKSLEKYFTAWTANLAGRASINNPKISIKHVREVGEVAYMKDVPPDWAKGS